LSKTGLGERHKIISNKCSQETNPFYLQFTPDSYRDYELRFTPDSYRDYNLPR